MPSRTMIGCVALAAVVLLSGCVNTRTTACRCPQPVHYDDQTIKKITAALRSLPADNVLHQAMDDYEDERDDLRICIAGGG